MLNEEIKVSLPERGIAYKKVSGKTYVYYVTETYRNEQGKPTCKRVSIGKLDEVSNLLIPNRNYYEIYMQKCCPQTGGIRSCGIYHICNEIFKKLGIHSILKKYFPESTSAIETVAQYMLSEGNVMYYLEDYADTHKIFSDGNINSAQSSRLFSSIREEEILLFFREWMKHKKSKEYIAYDVTSISSYSHNMKELEWGYNRDKEQLPQINIGMYYGEESRLPLYYRIYPGSISDKAHLKYMVADNEFINARKTRFVMDRGFYSADNMKYLTENGYRFIIALPGSLKYCSTLIEQHREKIVNHSEFLLGKDLPYGLATEINELGFRMKVHIYYDPHKAVQESEAFYQHLEAQENDLRNMHEPPDKKWGYNKYFYINRSKDGGLGFMRNHSAIDEKLRKCGFFLIAETDFEKTTAEILQIYRQRDTIEKSFDQLKNELDMKRLYLHGSDALRGKLFVAFISLIVRSYMMNCLSDYMHANKYTFKKILLELDKITCLDIPSQKNSLRQPLSKTQREIFNLLDISCIA